MISNKFAALAVYAILCCLSVSGGHNSKNESEIKTLVLFDSDDLKLPITHSQFFHGLTLRGHKLVFARADDSALALTSYGEFLYDNLIIFSPRAEDFGGTIDVQTILEFIDEGKNVLIAATSDSSDIIRELVNECGFLLPNDDVILTNHFVHHPTLDDGNQTTFVSDNFIGPEVILNPEPSAGVIYRGWPIAPAPSNPLVLPVLRAPPGTHAGKGR
eukprot:CAMPEP_0113698718 /NCGR_PEP_ID=MMETSP0038_2-20120614/22873_1 /TAXON_ID=2898 /ORGANISM="Cryptomonas paramecium" /LENGTH=215 /DNA_ID=CAMNT_0000621927 /DNA_START=43 /DNA_END=686 /DNA_ORIENTATION=+ /assembly_acc=CAM_ASM_000170